MSYVQQMGDVSYLGIGQPGFPFVRLRDAAHIAAEADAELAALRQRLEQAENRERLALTEIKTLKDEKAALEARFALAVELAEAALKADLLLNGGLPFVGTPAEDRFYEALDAYCAAKKEANHD